MVRGRGYSSRGSSYRGSNRGSPWNGGYGRSSREHYSYDNYDKGRFNERYTREEYPKPYRMDSYSRDRHSPERKRPRNDGPSRHEYSSRYESYPPERRSYSDDRDRHLTSPYSSRREDYRKPVPSPSSPRAGGRGRLSSRGTRGFRRDRGGVPIRRRLAVSSYVIKKRGVIRGDYHSRRSNYVRGRSSMIRRIRDILSSEKESVEDEVTLKIKKEPDDKTAVQEGIEVKTEPVEGGDTKVEKLADTVLKGIKSEDISKSPTRTYVKLLCPQCNINVPTFSRYESHLHGKTHLFAMRKVAAKQRSILSMLPAFLNKPKRQSKLRPFAAQMRQAQRNSQNELEKTADGITEHTVFCPLCKLNYKQERAVHQATPAHKNMKKFLLPTCKVCKINFKSPMVYEHHLCSVPHLKRKQKLEETAEEVAEEDNLEEFTTIDSIGEVGDENTASADEAEREERRKRVCVGVEKIKKIEAHYCDLCRMFLPRGTENEYPDILAGHCRKRFHMQRFIRFKETQQVKKKAEKLQRKESAEKEQKDENSAQKGYSFCLDGESDATERTETKEEDSKDADTSKSADEDKLWEAVDKDLGELLEETDGREDDEDEERANGERYDRFGRAEKENEEDEEEVPEAEAAPVEKKPEESKN
ncbi:hypothetical protein HUJ04_008500 [Dendroctonus ponderosae]|nr:hypothetical protein HUJ04_008500 [Dendroctonus ponderosae]KAH1008406.1 hypothetical protein HUJ05_008961 [Dendroctonus ponderosae]